MTVKYNSPPSVLSSIGPTIVTQKHLKNSLVEAAKEAYFTQLADVINMPKHFGKKISQYLYLPVLDDRNINDQGIDANGVVIDKTKFTVILPIANDTYTDAPAATAAAAAVNAIKTGTAVASGENVAYSETVLNNATGTQADAVVAAVPGSRKVQGSGNLYGSSKDVGTILGKLPLLGENGGRVNKVGSIRVLREGVLAKMGIFREVTQEATDFDDDPQLGQHLSDEMIKTHAEITEAVQQIDLLHGAGVVAYPGTATKNSDMTAEGATPHVVTYQDLERWSQTLSDNRVEKKIKMITGSRMVDTATIAGAFPMFIGSELLPTFKAMKDLHGDPAFIPVHKYAAGGQVMRGEVGSVGDFRLICPPEMQCWAGTGAKVGTNPGYRATNGRYDVFPMLVVGQEAFSAIGFQTGSGGAKFRMITKAPGEQTADRTDPYGETGFSSIKWYYGTIITRPERILVGKSVARI